MRGKRKDSQRFGNSGVRRGRAFGGKAISFDGSGKSARHAPLNLSVAAMPQVTFGGGLRKGRQQPQYGIISTDDGNFDRQLGIDTGRPPGRRTGPHLSAAARRHGAHGDGKWVFLRHYDQAAAPPAARTAFYVERRRQTSSERQRRLRRRQRRHRSVHRRTRISTSRQRYRSNRSLRAS